MSGQKDPESKEVGEKNSLKEIQNQTQTEMQPLTDFLKTRPDIQVQNELTSGLAGF
jgi:hypothetical protein